MAKTYIGHTPYLRNHTSFDYRLWQTCVNDNISRSLFYIFKILIFWVVRMVKVQKMAKMLKRKNCSRMKKKSCQSHSISQELYIMLVIFGANDMSRKYFHFFKILIFGCFQVVKGQKMTQNCQIQSIMFHISGFLDHIKILGTQNEVKL